MNGNPAVAPGTVRHPPDEDEQVTETLAALRTYDALDVLTALSFRQKQDRLATAETETMPRVRPPQRPAQRGPGSHRKPRETARRHQHRSPSPVRGGFGPAHTEQVVAIIPAYNEEETIEKTIVSLLRQTRRLDLIVVVANNCTDETVARAEKLVASWLAANVTVLDLHDVKDGKAEALNIAWNALCLDADFVMTVDADSELPPHAVASWIAEFGEDPALGGSSPQVVMTGNSLLCRMQRSEFTKSATFGLKRNKVSVISGTGCCYRNEVLREVALRPDQEAGPWTYNSIVEDFYLTYRLRQAGWKAQVSPGVWCDTGSMQTLRALWYQRIKWQTGTTADLISFGFNRLTWRDWGLQSLNFIMITYWLFWISILAHDFMNGGVSVTWHWLIIPAAFAATELLHCRKIHGRDWIDVAIAAALIPSLVFSLMNVGWCIASWRKVMSGEADDKQRLWEAQALAEGITGGKELETVNAA
jgi:glycosyltransferase involved in cell wall biosynthesis